MLPRCSRFAAISLSRARLSCWGKELQLSQHLPGLGGSEASRAAAPPGTPASSTASCAPRQGRLFQPSRLVEQKHSPGTPAVLVSGTAVAICDSQQQSRPSVLHPCDTPCPWPCPGPVPTSLPSLPGVPALALPSAPWVATPCPLAAPPVCRLHPNPSWLVTRAGADTSTLFAGSCTRTGSTGLRST